MSDLRRFQTAAVLSMLVLGAGCAAIGVIADAVPKPPIPAKYELTGQPVAVMVWVDRGLALDWPGIQRELAGGVQSRLKVAADAKVKPLEGVTFPLTPDSVVRWQKDFPGYASLPVTSFAHKLNVPRVIYIEIDSLSTRTAQTLVLYRGNATASVKVLEVEGETSKVVFEQRDIVVHYPKTVGEDGTPSGNDYEYYVGTIQTLADEISKLFIEHPAE